MMSTNLQPQEAARQYARCLLRLHDLDPRGEQDLPECDSICGEMDRYWAKMTGIEQQRMKGLSEDLYALADQRSGVVMTEHQRHQWTEAGKTALATDDPPDADTALAFLRRPFPVEMPWSRTLFLQARCWETLGDPEVALVFMREAEQRDPDFAAPTLLLLQRTGRADEAAGQAERILARQRQRALELLIAG